MNESRTERAIPKQRERDDLREKALIALSAGDYEAARKALNRAKALDDEIATLLRYATDEEHRLALIRQMEAGFH